MILPKNRFLFAKLSVFASLIFATSVAVATNRRHITTFNGLSNMSVLSLMQDRDGFIWAATCDGVDIIENSHVTSLSAGNNGTNEFSGNLVETIQQDDNGIIWVHTNYGLDRYDVKSGKIEYFRDINASYINALSANGDMVVLSNAGKILFYDNATRKFRNLGDSPFPLRSMRSAFYDARGTLWIATTQGVYQSVITPSTHKPKFRQVINTRLRTAYVSQGVLYYLSEEMELCSYIFAENKYQRIFSLTQDMRQRGDISCVVADGNDYIVAFKNNGAVRLRNNANGYAVEPFDIRSGVFAVLKDRNQDIIWFGTDGEGIYYYTKEPYAFFSQTNSGNNHKFSKPVRSIYSDKAGNVWTGTKGDGLFCFRNFTPGALNNEVNHYTTANSELPDNDVYALAASRRQLFWIGTQGRGLAYFSFIDNRLHRLEIPMMHRLQSVHAIYELNENELWIATLGEGVFRLTIGGTPHTPVVTAAEEAVLDTSDFDANAFFCIEQQNDSILWFGNRGRGAYRYNRLTRKYTVIDLSSGTMPVANDVFAIHAPKAGVDTVFCATSAGLIKIFPSGVRGKYSFKEIPMPANQLIRTAHTLLSADDKHLLISTNFGILSYQLPSMAMLSYASGIDFSVSQFSDGAAYKDAATGRLYFGGVNGFVAIEPTQYVDQEYSPRITFRSLTIDNKAASIWNFLDDKNRLVLSYKQNDFTISFIAIDYSHGHQYTYRYRLLGASGQWVDCTGDVTFINMSPGEYSLEVCYNDGRRWSEPFVQKILIEPPFYASTTAYIIYILMMLGLLAFSIGITVRIQHRKRNAIMSTLHQKRKEDIYEAKLRFFTNITHELFTPLTIINGSCERMMKDGNLSPQNLKLTTNIHRNSSRLTELIQELIEFRRIDTDYRTPDVEALDVSKTTLDIAENFTILTERKHITFTPDITPDIIWPTDRSGFVTIVNNLMSNALKYTPDGGSIKLSLSVINDCLNLAVANTGEGIAPENISKIFDRYKVLERFERLSAAGTIRRNGLGLAVCDGLTRLLNGKINVDSEQGKLTTFTVTLPRIEITRTEPAVDSIHYQKLLPEEETPFTIEPEDNDTTKQLVYIVDDDHDILNFTADCLRDTFRVRTFDSATEALDAIKKKWPEALVCDVVMEGMSGTELVKILKEDKTTRHIPVIQLSSSHSEDDKIQSLEAGADIYITKPFKEDYLRTVITRLIQNKENLKEYFDSSISAFEKIDGKVIHADDQNFFQRVLQIIETNIDNPELSTRFVAEQLGLSVRNLYRRLEGITDQTPTLIIKEARLNVARNMLIHSTLSIDEVIYKSGFNNRGTFFKLFQQRFGCTPKQFRDNNVSSAKSDLGIS